MLLVCVGLNQYCCFAYLISETNLRFDLNSNFSFKDWKFAKKMILTKKEQ